MDVEESAATCSLPQVLFLRLYGTWSTMATLLEDHGASRSGMRHLLHRL